MRPRLSLFALLLLSACAIRKDYLPETSDTGDTGDDGGTEDGGGDDGGIDGDGGGDGGSDGGDDGGGGGSTGGDSCPNLYHPLDESGWSKTFSASFSGSGGTAESGTATEQGLGARTLPDGSAGWAYKDTTTTAGESYDVTTYVGCNLSGDEGMFIVGWDGTYTMLVGGFYAMSYSVEASLSSPRKYLPAGGEIGAVGAWSFNYTLSVQATDAEGAVTSNPYSMAGDYTEGGFTSLTLFDGTTVNAYRLINIYSKVDNTGKTVNGYIEQHWVKGLGLVKETHVDADTGATIASKTLTAYSGLSVIP